MIVLIRFSFDDKVLNRKNLMPNLRAKKIETRHLKEVLLKLFNTSVPTKIIKNKSKIAKNPLPLLTADEMCTFWVDCVLMCGNQLS